MKKKEEDSFISSYKFEDKRLSTYKKFLDAQKLPSSKDKNLIIQDLVSQMEHVVSSSPHQFWLDPLKVMASAKIFTCPSLDALPPNWQDEIGKLLESQRLDHSDSTVKIKMSSDNHEGKLQVSLQKILDYKKERDKCHHYIREFGDQSNTRKTGKSNVN